ncbi:hypothetical protein TPHA_0A03620 [Tetrapisispora phaffii CBS 4417]|uniref:Vacuolar import and degradation protein 24 n=1 Tax=Tetrapisispora phaffii (strain ATCC 24235 / CBS 4417 / NBRC 1672 / NRRL Y-8282 / UCD 70-5) TaxID=1071381 RepID=G8BNG0_TETPH|nr:hypothetical protein TPHA_0A03620 [Tetrapisispora phaffii CBS 4417]CCE61438.1 hypothetical protein TPHA_0A03620 [Tetrapisispora phaffii CBS 4417]
MIHDSFHAKRNIPVNEIKSKNRNGSKEIDVISHNHSYLKLNHLSSSLSLVVAAANDVEPASLSDQNDSTISKIDSCTMLQTASPPQTATSQHRVSNSGTARKKYIHGDTSNYTCSVPSPTLSKHLHTDYLRQNMVFKGHQISGYKSYEVVIELSNVLLPTRDSLGGATEPHITGSLTIKNLTAVNPEITTYFDSYVVTSNSECDASFGFLSSDWVKNSKIDLLSDESLASFLSDDANDYEHWSNFHNYRHVIRASYNEYESNSRFHKHDGDSSTGKKGISSCSVRDSMNVDDYLNGRIPLNIDNYRNQRFIFMRWKERFLLPSSVQPDDTEDSFNYASNIRGANFDGYYYVVHDQLNGSIKGFYYHPKATKFQQLELYPVDQKNIHKLTSNYSFN